MAEPGKHHCSKALEWTPRRIPRCAWTATRSPVRSVPRSVTLVTVAIQRHHWIATVTDVTQPAHSEEGRGRTCFGVGGLADSGGA